MGIIDGINYDDDDYDDDGFDYKTCGLAVRRMHINEKRSSVYFSSPGSSLLDRFQNDEWCPCDEGIQLVLSVKLIHFPRNIRNMVPSMK